MMEITSPIAGKVWKLLVSVGDKVELDDEVLILEAMKMETPVFADDAGTVVEVKVKEGDEVAEGDVLVVIE
jgi:acetyl-CoA carboxylase biotin carboxyl carrier protein